MQTCADRGLGRVEDFGELRDLHVLPVVELEESLLLNREMLERFDETAVFLVARHARAGSRDELCNRGELEVELGVTALARAEDAVELVASDGEEVGAEGGLAAELIAGAQAGEERGLGKLVGVGLALRFEEAVDGVEVTREEGLARFFVAVAPAIEE